MYKIVESNSKEDLAKTLECLFREGWQLEGGVSIAYRQSVGEPPRSTVLYAQAITKDER